ncbi:hypothetical protein CVT25_013460 [Psilocybe cyanescens]|uniref:ABC transmembrane type-1 domain-containing protein n=1 Tax=Psilocybe cyanescens TaxID=93625 RepID=A0A409WTL6_PSICY|nr:hypothetical protein CVT25_013460 [Psilocybe cyanescens]
MYTLIVLLLTTLSVLIYIHAWTFAAYSPVAHQEHELVEWVTIVIPFIASVITPLLKPRYSSSANASLEPTASYWSLLSYSFLDPIIWLGYSSRKISQDALPPLAEFDTANVLRENSFKILDRTLSKSRRHIFLNLVKLYWSTGLRLVGLLIIQSFTVFFSPLAINRLLSYLEVGREKSAVRPWVCVSLLFLGPMVSGVVLQCLRYYSQPYGLQTRLVTQIEAILTQLVCEHALRIRMKSDAPKSTQEGSLVLGDAPRAQGANLLGKINSLITTDLANIREARDFMSLAIYIPLHVSLAIWFLYVVLGWSAFVGLAVIIALLPVPGYVASCIHKVEIIGMGKTDGRVQDVTETLNVLRMIKLFGWENKSNEKLRSSREEELGWITKRVLNMIKGISNYLIPIATMMATYATYVVTFMPPRPVYHHSNPDVQS